MRFRTPLARVRGLGSAREGTRHFWMQRLTAVAMVPLGLWFMYSVVKLVGADHATATAWVSSPFTTVVLIGFIVAAFHHGQLGMQVIIEDYLHAEAPKLAAIIATKLAAVGLGAAAIIAVLRIAL